MNSFLKEVEVRWADLDPNFHLRHSVYYDYGASIRIEYLQQNGITPEFLRENNLGPIIFREECLFKREIRSTDKITIDLRLIRCTPNASRWSIQHHIFKNGDTLSAILTVDGAWIDTVKRKLATPPPEATKTFRLMPVGEGFEWS
jgi:acyl-CoA thioester hydrolase